MSDFLLTPPKSGGQLPPSPIGIDATEPIGSLGLIPGPWTNEGQGCFSLHFLVGFLFINCVHTEFQHTCWMSAHMLKFSTHAEFQHTCWNLACVLEFSMRAEFQHTCWFSACVLNFSTRADFQHVCWFSACVLIFSMRAEFQHVCWISACVQTFSMCAEIQHTWWNSACAGAIFRKLYICSSFPLSVCQEMFSMQHDARQTCKKQGHLLKQNFSETITPIDNRCMSLLNLSVNPIISLCWCWSLLGLLLLK